MSQWRRAVLMGHLSAPTRHQKAVIIDYRLNTQIDRSSEIFISGVISIQTNVKFGLEI